MTLVSVQINALFLHFFSTLLPFPADTLTCGAAAFLRPFAKIPTQTALSPLLKIGSPGFFFLPPSRDGLVQSSPCSYASHFPMATAPPPSLNNPVCGGTLPFPFFLALPDSLYAFSPLAQTLLPQRGSRAAAFQLFSRFSDKSTPRRSTVATSFAVSIAYVIKGQLSLPPPQWFLYLTETPFF